MGQKTSHPRHQSTKRNYHSPRRSEIIEIIYEDEPDYETVHEVIEVQEDDIKSGDMSYPTRTGSPRISEVSYTFSPRSRVTKLPFVDNKRKTFHFRQHSGSETVPYHSVKADLTLPSIELNQNAEISHYTSYKSTEYKPKQSKVGSTKYHHKSFDSQLDSVNQVGDRDLDVTETLDYKVTPLESDTCYHEFPSFSPAQDTQYEIRTPFEESNPITIHSKALIASPWKVELEEEEEEKAAEADDERHQNYDRTAEHSFFVTTHDSPSTTKYPSPKDHSTAGALSSSCDACYQLKRSSTYHKESKPSKQSTPAPRSTGLTRVNTVHSQPLNSPIVELSFAMNEISSEFVDPSVHHVTSSDDISNWTKYLVDNTNRTLQNEAYATRFLARNKLSYEKEVKLTEPDRGLSRLTGRSSNTSTVDLRMEPAGDGKNLTAQPSSNISITARSATWCGRKSPSLVLFTLRPVLMYDECELPKVRESYSSVHKKIGLTNLEGCYVGGNVTSHWRPSESFKIGDSNPKLNQSESPNTSALSPISRPIHVYSYRFWVTNSPSIDQIFKSSHDRRIESIGRLSDCRIRLTKNMRRNPQGFIQRMVNIIAPSGPALQKCCKLFDDKFPEFYASSGLLIKDDELANPSNFGIRPSTARSSKRHKHSTSSHHRNRSRQKKNRDSNRKLRKIRSSDYDDIRSFDTHHTSPDTVNLMAKYQAKRW